MVDEPTVGKQARPFPRPLLVLWALALLVFPFALWLLPADHFDEGESICPSVLLFDTECPGCGSTRAIQHLHHAEFDEALYYHAASPLLYVFLIGLWAYWLYLAAARLGWLGEKRALQVDAQLRGRHQRRLERRAKRWG